jgi:hypothetical protein
MSGPVDSEVKAEFYRLACDYARAMDRNEPELLARVLAEDCVIEAPGVVIEGLTRNQTSPGILREMFLMTQHVIHNQTLTIKGDTAEGETYCTASHVAKPAENETKSTALVWAIRYQDHLARTTSGWRFTKRSLIVDWSETRPITVGVAW